MCVRWNNKLNKEVAFLERMIDNLLLSDRLSMPYSILDYSKIQTSEIIYQTLKLFPEMEKKINVNNSIPNEEIRVDVTKFVIALRNLIDNAIKYSEGKEIDLNIDKNKDFEFCVKDSGIGISNKLLKNITEPFFQANTLSNTKGFGLGLTICKKIIDAHNGRLSIKSKIGEGSIFILSVPAN